MTVERVSITDTNYENEAFVQDIVRYRFACQYVSGKRVLDIACGTGYGSNLLSDEGKAFQVIGIDGEISTTKSLAQFSVAEKIGFSIGRVDKLPLPSGVFDTIVSLETLEHITNPEEYLSEMKRVLSPNGVAIISTPINRDESRFKPTNYFHVREYNEEEFQNLLERFFGDIQLSSQITSSQQDRLVETVYANQLGRLFRHVLRRMVSQKMRTSLRQMLGLKGLHATNSEIVNGVHANAHVQIAVVRH